MSRGVDVMQIFLEVVWTDVPMFTSSLLRVAMLRVHLRKVEPFLLQCCVVRCGESCVDYKEPLLPGVEMREVRELSCDKDNIGVILRKVFLIVS